MKQINQKNIKILWLILLVTGLLHTNWSCEGNSNTLDLLNGSFINVLADTTPPNILTPLDGSVVGLDVVLQWTSKSGASTYNIEVATDSTFTNPVAGSPFTVSAPDTTYEITLAEGNTYYWRVAADTTESGKYGNGSFDAFSNIIYVYCAGPAVSGDPVPACSDTGAVGHKSKPFQTIGGALAEAARLGIPEIRVAARDSSGTAYRESIVLRDGVSVFGGYSPDFATQNAATYPTIIEANDTLVAYAGSVYNTTQIKDLHFKNVATTLSPTFGIKTENCSNALSFFNVSINGGAGAFAYGMYNTNVSRPLLTNVSITTGNTVDSSIGVSNDSGSKPEFTSSSISTGSAATTFGVFNVPGTNSGIVATDSIISSGTGINLSIGIGGMVLQSFASGGDIYITNSEITGGNADTTAGFSIGIAPESGTLKGSIVKSGDGAASVPIGFANNSSSSNSSNGSDPFGSAYPFHFTMDNNLLYTLSTQSMQGIFLTTRNTRDYFSITNNTIISNSGGMSIDEGTVTPTDMIFSKNIILASTGSTGPAFDLSMGYNGYSFTNFTDNLFAGFVHKFRFRNNSASNMEYFFDQFCSAVDTTGTSGNFGSGAGTFITKTQVYTGHTNEKLFVTGNSIYLGTMGGGLWISLDHGDTWTNYLALETVQDVFAVPGATNATTALYAATNNGLKISTNGGANWTNYTTTSGQSGATTFIGHNTVNGVYVISTNIYAATSGGLSISTDSGANWTNYSPSSGNFTGTFGNATVNGVFAIKGATTGTDKIYAATNGGLSVSTDSGANWTNTTTGLGSNQVNGVYVIPGAPDDAIYAATNGGISIWPDSTTGWVNHTTGLGSNMVLSVAASGNNVFAATTNSGSNSSGGFSVSTDNGANWTNYQTNFSFNGISISGNRVYSASSGQKSNSEMYGFYSVYSIADCAVLLDTNSASSGNFGVADGVAIFGSGFNATNPSTWTGGLADVDNSGGWSAGDLGADLANCGVPTGVTPGAL